MPNSGEGRGGEIQVTDDDSGQSLEHARDSQPLSGPSILKIYESISPESVPRILKMVEREQSHEKAEFRFAIVRLILLILVEGLLIAALVGLIITFPKDLVGSSLVGTLIGVAAGALAGIATMVAVRGRVLKLLRGYLGLQSTESRESAHDD